MALSVDTTSHATAKVDTGTNGIAWNHTCGASANKLAVLWGCGISAASMNNFTATYNGVAMTRQVTAFDGSFCGNQGFYLDSPATGSPLSIVVKNAGDGGSYQMAAVGISFNGATAGAPQTGTNTATSANGSVTVAGSVSGDIVVGSMMNDLGPTGTTTEGQTLIFEDEDVNADTDFNAERANAVGASTVLSWTHSSVNWSAIGMAINGPASAATDSPVRPHPLLMTLQRDTSMLRAMPIPSYLRDSIPAAIVPAIPGNTQQPILAAFERRFGRMPMGRIPPALPPLVTASAWSSQGDSSASWTGSSTAASAWSSSGDATATWVGASLAASVWNASGDGTATWVGASKAAGIWSASGDSTATWVGAARGSGVWSASGDSAAAWTGASTAVSVWSSSGDSSAAWTGGSLAAGVWSASGDSSAAWIGTSGGNVWSSSGDSVAQWVGAADSLSIWSASGDSLALFVGTSLFDGANELGAKPLGHGLRKRKLRHVPAKLKDQHPDDIERERRMLEEYIATLKPQRARRGKGAAPVAVTPAAPAVAPRLSEAMASLATMQELARISRANQVAEEDRRKAEKERQRRRAVAVLLMMTF